VEIQGYLRRKYLHFWKEKSPFQLLSPSEGSWNAIVVKPR
jgi:hypothetical protein